MRVGNCKIIFIFFNPKYVVGTQVNRLKRASKIHVYSKLSDGYKINAILGSKYFFSGFCNNNKKLYQYFSHTKTAKITFSMSQHTCGLVVALVSPCSIDWLQSLKQYFINVSYSCSQSNSDGSV